MKIIGLDVGERRIGVAKVDLETRIAVPIGFVLVNGSEWEEIAKIARLNNTNWFVLGLPRNNSGLETQQTLFVKNFAKILLEKIPDAKIRFQDETLTSVEAEDRLKKRKRTYEKGEIDAEAAAIILQDFVEGFKKLSQEEELKDEESEESDTSTLKSLKKKSKKKKIIVISIVIVVILGLLGTTLGLKYRDYVRAEREKYYADLEASMAADVFNFTIKPGETIFDIQDNLIELGYSEEEVAEAFAADYDFEFLKTRPEGASLEGYLFGETHEFYKDATVKEILTKFLEGTEKMIEENNLEAKYAEQNLSLFEGITLASIVQKESPGPEMATVAQIFLLRLKYGWTLGSDVTVTYALDVLDPNREIYQDNSAAIDIDSCYNTRKYAGLPCGPISNPGLTALLAVANPSDTAYLYFLTGDDGVMYYSYTEAEHNQNIHLHCQNLCQVQL